MWSSSVLALIAFCVYSASAQTPGCQVEKLLKPGETYEIQSPRYPLDYNANTDCSWKFTTPIGNALTMYCPEFDLDSTKPCNKNILTVNAEKFCSGVVSVRSKSGSPSLNVGFKSVTNKGKFKCTVAVQPDPCACGRSKTNRIVGGTDAKPGEFPFHCYFKDARGLVCSGTIITNTHIVTAAHCVTGRKASDLKVVVGDYDISTTTETNSTVVIDAKTLIIHQNYNSDTSKNDIAIIELQNPISYNADVGPVCLPFSLRNDKLEDKTVTLVGWGTTEFGGPLAKKLQKVDVKTTTQAKCVANYPKSDSTMLCTNSPGKDACQKDSGGGVYYTNNNRVYSVGVISGGAGCASELGGLNTRVTSQMDWILSKIYSNLFCTI